MRILLDTHIALWAVVGSRRLAPRAKDAIFDADEVFVSVVSLWEIAIKHSLGKGDMPVSSSQAFEAFSEAGYAILEVRARHALAVEQLQPLHNDPFDRMLVAQALVEALVLVTRDEKVASYGGTILRVA